MNAILWLPRVVYKLYFLILFAGYLILGYPFFHWATVNEARFPIAFRRLNNWSKFLTFFSGIYVHKKGVGNLPKNQPYVLCANHSSYLDITIIYRVLDDYFVMMGKGEIRTWPLFNRFFTTGMNILVDRESRLGSHKALEEAKVALDKGHNVVVFPEGGIPDFIAPKMRGFKNGAFKMAIEKPKARVNIKLSNNFAFTMNTAISCNRGNAIHH